MRLLFERDLTPHPEYAAWYKWLQQVQGTMENKHMQWQAEGFVVVRLIG